MPSVNSFETDMRKLRRKRRTKRYVKNLAFVFAVLIVAGLIYITKDAWLDYFDGILAKAQTGAAVQNDGELAGGNYPIDISKKTNTSIGKIQKFWTLFADTAFYVYDSSGDIVYSEQASYSNPIVEQSERRTLVYDQGGYSFTVLGPRKQIYSKRLSDQILLGSVGADGSVAIVTQNDKYDSYLTIYDKNGSEIYHWADGTMIMAAAIDQNGKGCILASVYARGGDYKTVLTRLNFDETEVELQTAPVETLAFEVAYCSGGMWLVGDDRLVRFNSDGGVEQTFEYNYQLSSFSLSEKLAALAFKGAGGNGEIAVIQAESQGTYVAAAAYEIADVYASDSRVYILESSKIDALDSGGNLVATAPLDTVYREFSVLGDEIFLLGYHTVEKIEFSV